MNNIEKIIQRIDEEAQSQIDTIEKESAASVKKLREEYSAKTEADVAAILENAQAEAVRIAERRDSAAKLEARNKTLEMKQTVISKLFDKAASDLCALPQENYVELLASFALRSSQSGSERIILSASDRERCGEAVTKRANEMLERTGRPAGLTLSDETRDIMGGLILSDGRIEYNCAMDAVVGSFKSELMMEAAKILFE